MLLKVVCSSVGDESDVGVVEKRDHDERVTSSLTTPSKRLETTTETSSDVTRTSNNNSNGSFVNIDFLQITPTTIQVGP